MKIILTTTEALKYGRIKKLNKIVAIECRNIYTYEDGHEEKVFIKTGTKDILHAAQIAFNKIQEANRES